MSLLQVADAHPSLSVATRCRDAKAYCQSLKICRMCFTTHLLSYIMIEWRCVIFLTSCRFDCWSLYVYYFPSSCDIINACSNMSAPALISLLFFLLQLVDLLDQHLVSFCNRQVAYVQRTRLGCIGILSTQNVWFHTIAIVGKRRPTRLRYERSAETYLWYVVSVVSHSTIVAF